jgi:hypothetical protein
MKVDKALEHFSWKFKNVWKATEKDVEAFNSILEWKEQQESIVAYKNESLCKLWVHQLMLLNDTEMYDAERAIQVIDEILCKSTYEWCVKLHENINLMRFKTLLGTDKYKQYMKENKPFKMRETGTNNINENSKEMSDILKSKVSEDVIIKFVNRNINRIINDFEK